MRVADGEAAALEGELEEVTLAAATLLVADVEPEADADTDWGGDLVGVPLALPLPLPLPLAVLDTGEAAGDLEAGLEPEALTDAGGDTAGDLDAGALEDAAEDRDVEAEGLVPPLHRPKPAHVDHGIVVLQSSNVGAPDWRLPQAAVHITAPGRPLSNTAC